MATPSWFDYKAYFNNKLASLSGYNDLSLKAAFEQAGYSVNADGLYKHFQDFGNDEGISPSAYFDVSYYLKAKTAQFYNKDISAVTQEEINYVDKAITNAGMSAWDHYTKFGVAENVNPSRAFDTSSYMEDKLAQLLKAEPDKGWTMDKLVKAFADSNINPIQHYQLFGQNEGLTLKPAGEAQADPAQKLTTANDTLNGTKVFDSATGNFSDTFDDTFTGTLGTLNNGDVINGFGGNDTLKADVAGTDTPVNPTLNSIENVVLTAQDDARIDAGNISGMTNLVNTDSRADLTVEDVRTNSNAMTITLANTDPNYTDGLTDSNDFKVLFNDQYLKSEAQTTTGTLNLQLIDTVGALPVAQDGHADPLYDNPYTGFNFTLNGKQYKVDFGTYNHSGEDTTPTYAELVTLIQKVIDADATLSTLGLTAKLGTEFTAKVGIGAHAGTDVTGTSIIITSTQGALTGGNWIAANGLPSTNSTSATMTVAASTTCPLIMTNIVLDNVGQIDWVEDSACLPNENVFGNNAGDMVVGAMGSRAGVERFNVTVEEGSWLSSLSSTNNTLRYIEVKNGTEKGNLFIGDTIQDGNQTSADEGKGTANWQDAARLLDFGPDGTAGITDVKVFDASAMEGSVSIAAQITNASYDKYLKDVDDTANMGSNYAPSGDFAYTFGSGADTLNMKVNGGIAADVDFKYVANAGEGNDLINFTFDSMTANQYKDQIALNNVTLNGGAGADEIWTWGSKSANANDANLYAGAVKINGGEGNDVVYAGQNGTDQNAVWVLNSDAAGAARAINVTAVNGAQPLNNDVLGTQGSFAYTGATVGTDITVTVTFKGIAATATIVKPTATTGTLTAEQINAAIISAIEGDARLSNLLDAKDGAGHSLLIESLIDGDMTNDLSIDFTGSTIDDATQYTDEQFATLNEMTLASSVTTTQGTASTEEVQTLDLTTAGLATIHIGDVISLMYNGVEYTTGSVTDASITALATLLGNATAPDGTTLWNNVATVAGDTTVLTLTAVNNGLVLDGTVISKVNGEATGTDLGTNSHNTINGGAGDDLITLGAHATNNVDTVVLSGSFGNDTIMNFNTGVDKFDVTAYASATLANTAKVDAAALNGVTDYHTVLDTKAVTAGNNVIFVENTDTAVKDYFVFQVTAAGATIAATDTITLLGTVTTGADTIAAGDITI